MQPQDFDAFLDKSLADTHLSRSERKQLSKQLSQFPLDARKLSQLRTQVFEKAREAMAHNRDRAVIDWLEDMLNALEGRKKLPKTGTTEAFFSPGPDCRAQIIETLHRAKKQVDICVFTITDNHICDALKKLFDRGVRLRIISDNHKSEDRGSDIDRLAGMGIPVKIDRTHFHMHHKFALFDRQKLLTGSYNWTISAANSNNENIIILDEPTAIRSFSQEFDRLWDSLNPYPH